MKTIILIEVLLLVILAKFGTNQAEGINDAVMPEYQMDDGDEIKEGINDYDYEMEDGDEISEDAKSGTKPRKCIFVGGNCRW